MTGIRAAAGSFAFLLLLPVGRVAGEGRPVAVSPGATTEALAIGGRCPTFTWAAAEGVSTLELVAYRLTGEGRSARGSVRTVDRLWRVAVPDGARAWTPGLQNCFAPGRYAWLVRAGGEWSDPLLFEVARPSAAEVREAAALLRSYLAGAELPRPQASPASTPRGLAASGDRQGGGGPGAAPAAPASSPVGGEAALRAEQATTTGAAHGVVGSTESSQGAGLAGANAAGGADLLIQGGVGSPSALVTEATLDRPSDGDTSFDFLNSLAGTMTLQVNGVDVVTSATDADTLAALACAADQIAKWDGAGWTCSPDGGPDTLAALACANGEIARWNGAVWECSSDSDSLGGLGCAAGQVPQWNGAAWICANVGTDTLASLSCDPNEIVHWSGAVWSCGQPPLTRHTCSASGNPASCTMSCAAGSIVWTGGCEAATSDSLTDDTPTQAGGIPTGWRCEAWDPLGFASVNGELYCVPQ
ncbi:MAG: hypothetical protein R3325_07460 [Thermoanaerobaculia bacterium]|nr:hypothetical protein [Thermoanaerobaculia bacterium]